MGKRVHFSPQGDGPAHYTILNYQPSSKQKITDSDRGDYVEIGSWSEQRLVINERLMFWNLPGEDGQTPISKCSMACPLGYRKQLIKADEVCCWACGKCEDYEYLVNDTTCIDCGQGMWPTADRKSCFDLAEKDLKHMKWSSWYSIVPAIFAVIGILATLCVIAVYIM